MEKLHNFLGSQAPAIARATGQTFLSACKVSTGVWHRFPAAHADKSLRAEQQEVESAN